MWMDLMLVAVAVAPIVAESARCDRRNEPVPVTVDAEPVILPLVPQPATPEGRPRLLPEL